MDIDKTKFKADPYNPRNKLISANDIQDIMKNLDIHDLPINNLALYQRAFVHKSYCEMKDYLEYSRSEECLPLFKVSYETLEFIGDSFLGNVIANYLYKRYFIAHNKDEGFLTKLKIRFVCGDQLAYLSDRLKMNQFMIISKHIEEDCDGRMHSNILEDILEAFIGAIYTDTGDFAMVEKFIVNMIEAHVDFSDVILHDNNYKDQILRYFQHNYKVHPTYVSVKEDNMYRCDILREATVVATGYGHSKKKSEQEASKRALIKFRVLSE
jgi:ribonuclease-3|tara:strand:- start:460 stop:1263 length:804 start_codon:yes stop_codon:yes gene_type:complete